MSARRQDVLTGALLGTAVGDALGLPRENLSPRRAARLFGEPPLRHAFLPGRGMTSDDTEHACMTAQALLAAPDDAEAFARSLAWRLRGWLLGIPGGVGFGTLRAVLKLWLGFPPHRSGVRSAGNGPAMRAPVLGACLGDGPLLREVVRASTRLTHTDPRAEEGALAIALAAAAGSRAGAPEPASFLEGLRAELSGADLLAHLERVEEHLRRGSDPPELAAELGCERGVTGFIDHTVPAVLFCWLRWPDAFDRVVEGLVTLGGDADTTAAIGGGLCGATLGASAIPAPWVDGLWEQPRSAAWIEALGARLAEQFPAEGPGVQVGPQRLFWPLIPARNLLFLSVVLLHGLRRLLPPY